MTTGQQIKLLRTQKKMTQGQLAEKAGVRPATVSEMEADKCNFKKETLKAVAKALGVRVQILLNK